MKHVPLTDYKLKNLKPKDSRYEVWESKSFGIRVFPTGKKSWVYMYRYRGTQKRLKLGEYPTMNLTDARGAHAKAQGELEKGFDPGEEKKLIKTSNLEALTIDELINEYIEKWAKARKRTWEEDQRILAGEVSRTWGKAKAKQIKRRDVVIFLDGIRERAPIMANRTLAVIRRMFNFAIERDILEHSPCTQDKMPSPETQKDRALSEEEIKIFWNKLDASDYAFATILALKMELITGQRKGEVITMRWNEIDLEKSTWDIPAEKSKNKKPHRVHLSKLAKDILETTKTKLAHENWVFPSPSGKKDIHISETAINKAVYRGFDTADPKDKTKVREPFFKGIEKFTPHDLRRTAASHMTALGIPRLVVSKVLNHVENSVTAIYDRHTYEKEKREALDAWSDKLENIIE